MVIQHEYNYHASPTYRGLRAVPGNKHLCYEGFRKLSIIIDGLRKVDIGGGLLILCLFKSKLFPYNELDYLVPVNLSYLLKMHAK